MYHRDMKIGDVEVLSLGEAAKVLGVTRRNLSNQAKRGRIQAVMLGDRYVVTADELARYKREQAGKPGRKPNPTPATPKEGA